MQGGLNETGDGFVTLIFRLIGSIVTEDAPQPCHCEWLQVSSVQAKTDEL